MDAPRSKRFDDIYFSPEDGRAETEHVFIKGNELQTRFQEWREEDFVICETGFGTGLNFLIAWEAFERIATGGSLHFISFEKYPLSHEEISAALLSLRGKQARLNIFLEKYPGEKTGRHDLQIADNIHLSLVFGDMNDEIPKLQGKVDAWFLDGFAPAKNPDMWSATLFENMARLSQEGTTFATFTAAGFVRRRLEATGFEVEKVPGFGRKREMLRGRYV